MNSTFARRVIRLERARSRELERDEQCDVTINRLMEMAFTAYRMAIAAGSAEEILANAQVREVYLGQDFKL